MDISGQKTPIFMRVMTILWQTISRLKLEIQDVSNIVRHKGTANSLLAKLESALQKIEDDKANNDKAAIHSLEAFINAVQAQQGKKIPEAEADALIADAQTIIDLLTMEPAGY